MQKQLLCGAKVMGLKFVLYYAQHKPVVHVLHNAVDDVGQFTFFAKFTQLIEVFAVMVIFQCMLNVAADGGINILPGTFIVPKRDLAHDTFDAADLSQLEGLIKPNTKLIYVESPANPTMVLVDIAAVVEIAHKHGIKVFIDNTFATPYNTTPLDLGVDAVIHSLTKYIGGHGDLLGGAVISNDEQFLRECRLGTLMHFGSVMAPFTAFLVCRGLKTLGVRMKQYNESALKIAKWLEANPKIETVRYPFLESNPQYAIAKKQMKGGGGMISFDVAGGLEAGKKFINSLKLCTLAVSLGDTETLVEQAAAMTHTMIPKEIREAAGITDGMIRMSVGLEDPDDIIADLKQALGD